MTISEIRKPEIANKFVWHILYYAAAASSSNLMSRLPSVAAFGSIPGRYGHLVGNKHFYFSVRSKQEDSGAVHIGATEGEMALFF